jgi:endoglucanase
LRIIFAVAILLFTFSFAVAGPVSYYGKLKVRPTTPFIYGAKSNARVQIRGVSFGWSNTGWESESFYNRAAVEHMAKDWKAEAVRAAYGSTSIEFSNTDALANRARIETVVEAAIENDIFVIIDWHSHGAQNETRQAKDFFAYMAEKYGAYDNVIFEIYNEPTRADWAAIKDYSEQVIPVIRTHSENLILVGTPNWSQMVQDAIGKKIKDVNLGYVLHFYAASHNVEFWRNNMNSAINDTMPIFITEYGTTNSDGGCSPVAYGDCPTDHYNTHNTERSDAWHSYMDSKKISSIAWNINDKYEGSAFFGAVPIRGGGAFDQSQPENWADTSKMTESGKYVFKKLNEYYKCVPWNPEPDVSCGTTSLGKYVDLPIYYNDFVEVYSLQGKKIGQGTVMELNLNNGVYILVSRRNGVKQTKILRLFK